ncbi:hypothetical protein V496_04190 [Pseudogymnoascus sp. VKM F-4515 (FW-2607)]|nr:hypothetical protein V496_04190 [Pseudogymnoascus sp. VKM F-4515 (FW-2607)]
MTATGSHFIPFDLGVPLGVLAHHRLVSAFASLLPFDDFRPPPAVVSSLNPLESAYITSPHFKYVSSCRRVGVNLAASSGGRALTGLSRRTMDLVIAETGSLLPTTTNAQTAGISSMATAQSSGSPSDRPVSAHYHSHDTKQYSTREHTTAMSRYSTIQHKWDTAQVMAGDGRFWG